MRALCLALSFVVYLAMSAWAEPVRTSSPVHANPQVSSWSGEATLTFVNPTSSDPLCLNLYIFNDSAELVECCAVGLASNAFCSADQKALLANPASSTSGFFGQGVYKAYSSVGSGTPGFGNECDAGGPYKVSGEIDAWYDGEAFTEASFDAASLVELQHACAAIEKSGNTGECFLPC